MKSTSYKIKIRASVNGVDKIPSHITWIDGDNECLLTPCYKEKDYIVIELIPECVGGSCIEGYVHFNDSCSTCEPLHFKRCFCSDDTECGDCEKCFNGICQSVCPIDYFCVDNKCVECDLNTPCKDGKICVDGKCVCPVGTFFSNQYNRCVICDNTTILDKCSKCINGEIVTTSCSKECDPLTGDCVDCLNVWDCNDATDGRLCCVNKVCSCCQGSVWSADLKKCIPVCNDEQCGTCQKCNQYGICTEVACPVGFKCVDDACVEWPCTNVFCSNGADCGKGCGCADGKCVPCRYLSCTDETQSIDGVLCKNAIGCECDPNNKCYKPNDCGQYCDGFTKCVDPGCTCYNNECVSCSNFSCNNTACADQAECICKGDTCEGKDVDGGDDCKDTFTIDKLCTSTDCTLTAKLNTKGCPCDPISFKINNISNNADSITLATKAYKNNTQPFTGFLTDKNFGNNELLGGVIDITTTVLDGPGGNVISTSTKSINANDKNEFANTTLSMLEYKNAKRYVIISISAKGTKTESNSCKSYADGEVGSYIFDYTTLGTNAKNAAAAVEIKEKKLIDKISNKKPLFIWSRTSAQDFRKVYPQGSEGNYTDTLKSMEDGLILGESYQVRTDCSGCASPVATHNDLKFCCFDPTVVTSECNTKVVITSKVVCKTVLDQASNYVNINGDEITINSATTITRTVPEGITSIKSYIRGTKTQCEVDHPLGDTLAPLPGISKICANTTISTTLVAPSGKTIKQLIVDRTPRPETGKTITFSLDYFTGKKPVKVVYEGGCFVTFDIDGCDDELLVTCTNGDANCTSGKTKGTLTATLKSGESATFASTDLSLPTKTGKTVTWDNLESKTYNINVPTKQILGTKSCTVSNKKLVELNWSSTGNLCTNGTTGASFTISAISTDSITELNGEVQYRIKLGNQVKITNKVIVGSVTNHTFTELGTYTLELVTNSTPIVVYCNKSTSIELTDSKQTILPALILPLSACKSVGALFTITGVGSLNNVSDIDITAPGGTISNLSLVNGEITGILNKNSPGSITMTITPKTNGCFVFGAISRTTEIKTTPIISAVNDQCDVAPNETNRLLNFSVSNLGSGSVTFHPSTGITSIGTSGNYSVTVTHGDSFVIRANNDICNAEEIILPKLCQTTPCPSLSLIYFTPFITEACTSGTPGLEGGGIIQITKSNFESIFGIGSWTNYTYRINNGNDYSFNPALSYIDLQNIIPGEYTVTIKHIGTGCEYTKSVTINGVCCADSPCGTMIEGSDCGRDILDECNIGHICECPSPLTCDHNTKKCVNILSDTCTCNQSSSCTEYCAQFVASPFSIACNDIGGGTCKCCCDEVYGGGCL